MIRTAVIIVIIIAPFIFYKVSPFLHVYLFKHMKV